MTTAVLMPGWSSLFRCLCTIQDSFRSSSPITWQQRCQPLDWYHPVSVVCSGVGVAHECSITGGAGGGDEGGGGRGAAAPAAAQRQEPGRQEGDWGARLPAARAALGSSRPRRAPPLWPPQVRLSASRWYRCALLDMLDADLKIVRWSAGASAAAGSASLPGQTKRVPSLPLSSRKDAQQKGGQESDRRSLQNTPPAPSMHTTSAFLTSMTRHGHLTAERLDWQGKKRFHRKQSAVWEHAVQARHNVDVSYAVVKGEDTVPTKASHVTRSPASANMLDCKLQKLLQVH